MANTLTGLIPIIYTGLDIVSRELCGLVRACSLDSSVEQAAKDQTVRSPVVPEATTEDITPGQNPANSGSQTITYKDIVITKSKASPILWNGEEQVSVRGQLNTIMVNQFAQSVRALVNLVEADLYASGYAGASRAYGTAGTAPFGTAGSLVDSAQTLKILDDNGAPTTDRHLCLGTAAVANIRGVQSGLFEVNRAGNDDLLRRGVIGDLQGFEVHTSAAISAVTAGTGSGYLVNHAAGYSAGDTEIVLDTGSGTILAGDVITFASDSNKYVVASGISAPGTITLAEPGLKQSLADNKAVTVVGSSTRNLGFTRNALHLAARAPQMPTDGNGRPIDAAADVMTITDPRSGLSFQVAMYAQYRQVKYEVGLAWGTAVIKPEHIAVLLG